MNNCEPRQLENVRPDLQNTPASHGISPDTVVVKTLPSFTHRRYNKAGMDGKQHPKLPKLTSRKSDLPKNRGEPEKFKVNRSKII
jgi:hypothetical protein